ncbi:MAG: LD-carboxypeptidase [Firmicutes bacterium]|nr:LD-carboxypeptidase [Bacillota bacterium]
MCKIIEAKDLALSKPLRLSPGDSIAITAPAMYVPDNEQLHRGIKTIEALGFKAVVGETVNSKYQNTTGTAEFRAREIERFFADPSIKAIVCLFGGDASFQLLKTIDYNLIKANPKIFSGMSDITHLHLAFVTQANLMSFHGIDLCWGFGVEDDQPAKKYNLDLFMQCCMNPEPLGLVPQFTPWETWRKGTATGSIIGGWFGAVSTMRNTIYYPNLSEYILFTEFIGAEPHNVQRDLQVMEANGFFEQVKGILIGQIIDCEEQYYPGEVPEIKEMILAATAEYNIPVIGNVDFGHGATNIPMPEGIKVEMDATNASLKILEPFVR